MERIELSKRGKQILLALYKGEYQGLVPDEDYEEFNLLEVQGLVHAVKTKGANRCEMHAPRLTDEGLAYVAANPRLKNPSIWDDKKYIINTIISVVALAVAIIALFK